MSFWKKYSLVYLHFFFLIGYVNAQSIEEQFDKDARDSENILTYPSDWKHHSAVILYQKTTYNFHHKKKEIGYEEFVTKKIKLLDKSSVETFSTFHLIQENKFRLKVIKPDGTKKDIDIIKEGVIEEIQGGYIKNQFQKENEKYYKIAVPDLEIGDIIFYQYYAENDYYGKKEHIFNPLYFLLNESYPVVKQEYEFSVHENFYINGTTLNGAPQFIHTKNDPDYSTYLLIDSLRLPYHETNFSYEFRHYPCIKFQVYYFSKNRAKKTSELIGEQEQLTNKITDSQLLYRSFYNMQKQTKLYNKLIDTKNLKSVAQKLNKAFYDINSLSWESEETKVSLFSLYCQNQKIPYEILFCIPKHLGAIGELCLKTEIVWCIRIPSENNTLYCFSDQYYNPNEFPNTISGTKAIYLKIDKSGALIGNDSTTIPQLTIENENYNEIINCFIDLDSQLVNMNRLVTCNGAFKPVKRDDLILNTYYSEKDKREEALNEYFHPSVELNNYSSENFVLKNIGTPTRKTTQELHFATGGQPSLIWQETISLKELLFPAKDHFIFSIGYLFGQHYYLTKNDKNRTTPFEIPTPKSYVYQLNLKIPDGYSADHLDGLKQKVQTAIGFFDVNYTYDSSTNLLVVKTSKNYEVETASLTEWKSSFSFFEKAYDFSQYKILLRKK